MGADRPSARYTYRLALHGLCCMDSLFFDSARDVRPAGRIFESICHEGRICAQRALPCLGTMAPRSVIHSPSHYTWLRWVYLACGPRNGGHTLDRKVAEQSRSAPHLPADAARRDDSFLRLSSCLLELHLHSEHR